VCVGRLRYPWACVLLALHGRRNGYPRDWRRLHGRVREPTGRMLGERCLVTLRELAAPSAEARTAPHAGAFAAAALSDNRADVPCALLYLLDADG